MAAAAAAAAAEAYDLYALERQSYCKSRIVQFQSQPPPSLVQIDPKDVGKNSVAVDCQISPVVFINKPAPSRFLTLNFRSLTLIVIDCRIEFVHNSSLLARSISIAMDVLFLPFCLSFLSVSNSSRAIVLPIMIMQRKRSNPAGEPFQTDSTMLDGAAAYGTPTVSVTFVETPSLISNRGKRV